LYYGFYKYATRKINKKKKWKTEKTVNDIIAGAGEIEQQKIECAPLDSRYNII